MSIRDFFYITQNVKGKLVEKRRKGRISKNFKIYFLYSVKGENVNHHCKYCIWSAQNREEHISKYGRIRMGRITINLILPFSSKNFILETLCLRVSTSDKALKEMDLIKISTFKIFYLLLCNNADRFLSYMTCIYQQRI